MYEILKKAYTVAKEYGLEIFLSCRRFKQNDVFKDGKCLASIGDSRFKDYHTPTIELDFIMGS